MTIHKALKVRIYPNEIQQTQINKTLGCCRVLYNMMLYERKEVYEKLKNNKRELYEYKYKTEKDYKNEFEWMKEADSVALQQSRNNLVNAYSNFFKSLTEKRKGKVGFPKFKKKKNGSSYKTIYPNLNVDYDSKKVKLPKLGWVTYRDGDRKIEGIIKSATVSRTPTNKYFVSVLYECELNIEETKIKSNSKIKGLDMSLENFYIDELGDKPEYERFYRKYEPKLKKLQRKMSKKKIGSNNWKKANHKVNRVHEKIKNERKDFTHKLSKKLVNENDVVVIENLSLQGMGRVLNLGKSVMDLGYSEFVRQLQYKSLWKGKKIIEASKWFASSKMCSVCGYIKKDLQLSDREWECINCKTIHNRDQNAGQNLVNYGKETLNLIGRGSSDFKLVEKNTSIQSLVEQVFSEKQEYRNFDLSQRSI